MALALPSLGGLRLAVRHRFVLALLVALLIAFAVAAGMAVLLPPGGARAIRLDAVAAALRGPGDADLLRAETAGPPVAGVGWLEVPAARRRLAALLRVDPADVRLLVASPVVAGRTVTAGPDGAPVRAGYALWQQAEVTSAPPAPIAVTAAPPVVIVPPVATVPTPPPAPRAVPVIRTPSPTPPPARPVVRERVPAPAVAVPVSGSGPVAGPTPAVTTVTAPVPVPAAPAPVAARRAVPTASGPMPEIVGPFRAALRMPAGRWMMVTPRAETVPTAAQQRILLWFLVALAVVLPLGWAVAMWLARPLAAFAAAAERSGRDPAAPMPPVSLADLAPATAAIMRLQGRILALSNDRAAFAGTVRNDVRAPLDRLRAGLDDVPRQMRDVFHDPVMDLEEAVTALELFLTDAAAPGVLERHDLGELVRMAATAAAAQGEPVIAETPLVARVEVDPVAVRRLLDQLIGYARRRGRGVVMTLAVDAGMAVVAMAETTASAAAGFASGLRGKAERTGGTRPRGPGLAVARSIARVHGGEVRLVRSEAGMIAELRLPVV